MICWNDTLDRRVVEGVGVIGVMRGCSRESSVVASLFRLFFVLSVVIVGSSFPTSEAPAAEIVVFTTRDLTTGTWGNRFSPSAQIEIS